MSSKLSLWWVCSAAIAVLIAVTSCGHNGDLAQVAGPDGEGVFPSGLAKPDGKAAVTQGVVVVAVVTEDGIPVEGVEVAFARSISGRSRDYKWAGTTDADGRAEIGITADSPQFRRTGVAGYYCAKASDTASGEVVDRWASIPVNGGKTHVVLLPIGGHATVNSGGYTAVYAFGDSYVDNGDFFEATGGGFPSVPPYWAGRWTNGKNFVDVIAENLGLELPGPAATGGTNYGFGGATVAVDWDYEGVLVRSVKTQVTDLVARLGSESADPSALYIFCAGAGDISAALEEGLDGATGADAVTAAAGDLIGLIHTLADKGAVHFLVLNQYDMGLTPIPGIVGNQAATDLCAVFNTALEAGLGDLGHLDVVQFDFDDFIHDTMSDFRYTDVLYLAQTESTNPDEFLFFDDFGHLTALPNRLLGNACATAVLAQQMSTR